MLNAKPAHHKNPIRSIIGKGEEITAETATGEAVLRYISGKYVVVRSTGLLTNRMKAQLLKRCYAIWRDRHATTPMQAA